MLFIQLSVCRLVVFHFNHRRSAVVVDDDDDDHGDDDDDEIVVGLMAVLFLWLDGSWTETAATVCLTASTVALLSWHCSGGRGD